MMLVEVVVYALDLPIVAQDLSTEYKQEQLEKKSH